MKFTLQSYDEDYANTLEFEAEQLDDILMYMKMFIQGSGFTWVQGELQFVDDLEYAKPEQLHSEAFFDFGRNR